MIISSIESIDGNVNVFSSGYKILENDFNIIYNNIKQNEKKVIYITVSKAAQAATERYDKKNYDRILVKFPKGTKEKIQATGETVNGFINRAVEERLEKQAEK